MLTRLRSILPDGTPKFPLRYRRMINSMSDRLDYLKSRYLYAAPYQTRGMELLRYYILAVDYGALDSYPTDLERYTNVIKFFKNSRLQAFDPVVNGNIVGGRLFRAREGMPPPEVWLNVDAKDPMSQYPLEKPWEEWQDLRSVRILYHDSFELLDEFNNSLLNYKKDLPSALIVSLDVATLIFKYYKYWKSCQASGVAPDINAYLKTYEYSWFYDDLLDIWILNTLIYVFENPETSVDRVLARMTIPVRVATDHMLVQGIEGLKEFVDLVKEGALRPQDLLEVKLFHYDTIKTRMNEIDAWTLMPERRQYLWCRTLVWLPYLRLMNAVLNLAPAAGITALMRERCAELYWRKFKYVNMPGIAYGDKVRMLVNRINVAIETILTNNGQGPQEETSRPPVAS